MIMILLLITKIKFSINIINNININTYTISKDVVLTAMLKTLTLS